MLKDSDLFILDLVIIRSVEIIFFYIKLIVPFQDQLLIGILVFNDFL